MLGLDPLLNQLPRGRVIVSIGLVAFAAIALLLGGQWYSERMRRTLEAELTKIEPMSGSEFVEMTDNVKPFQVNINRTYRTARGFGELKDYYITRFQQQGWKHTGEEPIYGESVRRTLNFQKDGYAASLEYTGDTAKYGWTYAVNVSWPGNGFLSRTPN